MRKSDMNEDEWWETHVTNTAVALKIEMPITYLWFFSVLSCPDVTNYSNIK
jgi:hypothetical protein